MLASGWSPATPRLTVAFADEPLHLELSVGGRKLFAGHWTMETVCDGQSVSPIGAWQELCWQSDKKCDFLELGVELAEGLQLERQIVLSKRDNVLLVADVVSAKDREPHRLRHAFSLPLARRVAWLPETETRDGVLLAQKQRTAVLPLGLNEWRSDPRGGTLVGESGRLTLADTTTGRSLYCGMIFDLDPRRSKKPRTWRQLTISEMLQVVPRDLAVGFRAQSGGDQWLVYRSLGPGGQPRRARAEHLVRVLRRPLPRGRRPRDRVDRNRSRERLTRRERHVDCRKSCGGCASESPERPKRRAVVPSDVTLVGVTKYVGAREAARARRSRLHGPRRKPPARTLDQRAAQASSLQRAGVP